MPCQSDYHYPSASEVDALTKQYRDKLDDVTRMLCALCKLVEQYHPDSIIQQSAGKVPGLREWWAKHKQLDAEEAERKRLEAEMQAAEENKRVLAKKALNKLTFEERKALGF